MKKQKRMIDIVGLFTGYVNKYINQPFYDNYSDGTVINDMLYGIGIAFEPERYKWAKGFELFKKEILRELVKEPAVLGSNKPIEEVAGKKSHLEVYECAGCGFHLGLDASYLEQVGSISIKCPSCGSQIDTEKEDWELEPE